MDLNCFFEGIEELANRMFGSQDIYDNLFRFVEIVKCYLFPPAEFMQTIEKAEVIKPIGTESKIAQSETSTATQ